METVNKTSQTKFCKNALETGFCKRKNCSFAHTIEALKKLQCKSGKKCWAMDTCAFFHGDETVENYAYRLDIDLSKITNKQPVEILKPASSKRNPFYVQSDKENVVNAVNDAISKGETSIILKIVDSDSQYMYEARKRLSEEDSKIEEIKSAIEIRKESDQITEKADEYNLCVKVIEDTALIIEKYKAEMLKMQEKIDKLSLISIDAFKKKMKCQEDLLEMVTKPKVKEEKKQWYPLDVHTVPLKDEKENKKTERKLSWADMVDEEDMKKLSMLKY